MERKSLSGVCDADPPGNSGYSVARQLPLMAAPGVLLVPHRARVQALTGHAFPVFHLPLGTLSRNPHLIRPRSRSWPVNAGVSQEPSGRPHLPKQLVGRWKPD